jgi:peptidoglycan/xylan/chitin deacetylase (PgdA/CDA1 family)
MRWSQQYTFLPFYHAIADQPLAHIRHLYPLKNSRQFVSDLDELLKYYHPISLADFQALQVSGDPPRRPVFLLSFDDGLRSFHDIVAPILLQKGVPAVCFLNSAFVDNQALFFRYKASLLLEVLSQNEELNHNAALIAWCKAHFPASSSWREALLSVGYANRALLDELAALVEVDFNAFLQEQQPYMSSAQIRKLQQQGFDFGAHSIDHPEYRFLNLEAQLRQTTESLAFVQRQFGVQYPSFSFPFTDFGVSEAFFTQLRGQDNVGLTFGCAGQKQDSAPMHFQRTPLEDGKLGVRDILHTELLYYLLKAPFGKNRITRR